MRTEQTNQEEHVLVCISASPNNARVIEAASILSRAFGAKLTALYVESPADASNGAETQRQLDANRKLAEKAGAEQAVSYGADIALQIAEFAKAAHVTKIVLGHASASFGIFPRRRDPSYRLAQLLPGTDLLLVSDEAHARAPRSKLRSVTLPLYRHTACDPDGGDVDRTHPALARVYGSEHHDALHSRGSAHRILDRRRIIRARLLRAQRAGI